MPPYRRRLLATRNPFLRPPPDTSRPPCRPTGTRDLPYPILTPACPPGQAGLAGGSVSDWAGLASVVSADLTSCRHPGAYNRHSGASRNLTFSGYGPPAKPPQKETLPDDRKGAGGSPAPPTFSARPDDSRRCPP